MNRDDGMDLADIPVQIAMNGVCVNRLPITGRNPLEISSDLNRLGIDDHSVLAETVDDLIDLLSLLRSAVAHRVAGVDNPGVGMGDEFVKGLGRFTYGDDIVGHSHVPSPVFGEADLLVHPRKNIVEGMVTLFEGDKKGVGLLEGFKLELDGPLRIDQGDDQVGFNKIPKNPLILEFSIDSVPLNCRGGTNNDVLIIISLNLVPDLFVLLLAGQLENIVGRAQKTFERFFACLREVIDGVVDLDLAVIPLAEGDDPP